METLIHADIFFVVTTAAIVLLTIGFIIVFVYVIKILHRLHEISEIVRTESDLIAEDVHVLRSKMRSGTFTWTSILHFFKAIFGRQRTIKK